ncbi:MAG: SRPBCC domain-containing protein [Myxococcaceae bacterium]
MLVASSAVAAEPDLTQVVSEGVVKASPEQLFRIWVDPAEYKKRLGVGACDIDFKLQGLIRTAYDATVKLDSEGAIHQQLLAWEPNRMVAFRIHRPPKGFPFPNAWQKVWSVVTLTDRGDGTTLFRLAMVGYDASEESQKMRAFFEKGNGWTLKHLQESFDPPKDGGVPR